MKRILLCLAIISSAVTASAQRGFGSGSGGNVQGYLGFTRSAPVFGVEYEAPQQFGGYFLFQGEEENIALPQVTAFGAFMKAHFDSGAFSAYMSPGFGFAMVSLDRPVGSDLDETFFGPSFRLGLLYQLSPGIGLGLENVGIYNWMSDEVGGVFQTTIMTVRVAL